MAGTHRRDYSLLADLVICHNPILIVGNEQPSSLKLGVPGASIKTRVFVMRESRNLPRALIRGHPKAPNIVFIGFRLYGVDDFPSLRTLSRERPTAGSRSSWSELFTQVDLRAPTAAHGKLYPPRDMVRLVAHQQEARVRPPLDVPRSSRKFWRIYL